MAVTLRASGTTTARTTSSQTVTLSTSTNAYDCVVLLVGSANTPASSWNTTPAAVSGLGATWVPVAPTFDLLPFVSGSSSTNLAVWVGYNCSAGQTSISISGLPNVTGAFTGWGLFSGVTPGTNPISSYSGSTSYGSSGAQNTSPSASYNANDLVIGLGFSYQWSNTTGASWSNGSTNTNFVSGTSNIRQPWGAYITPTSSGSTTFTTPNPKSGQVAVAGIMVLAATQVVTLTGSGSVSASGAGTVTTISSLTGSGTADTQGSGTLSAALPITGTGLASTSGSAALTVTPPFDLTGTGSADTQGSATFTVIPFVFISGTGTTSVSATASIYPFEPVAGSGSAGVIGQANIFAFEPVQGNGNSTVTGNASITAFLPLSGVGVISTFGNGTIAVYVHTGPGFVKGAINSPYVSGDVLAPQVRGKIISPSITGDTELVQP